MLEPNHNICLTFSAWFSDNLRNFAQRNFKTFADGYCLSETAVPHVTLCHFNISNQKDIDDIGTDLTDIVSGFHTDLPPVEFEGIGLRFGRGIHENYLWIELPLKKTPELSALQKSVDGFLTAREIPVTNPSKSNWHPHVTFCRIPDSNAVPTFEIDKAHTMPYTGEIKLSLGKSDKNGQFLGSEQDWQLKVHHDR